MRVHYDDRDYLVPKLQRYEERVLMELAREQVTHVPLSEYQPGAPHYEQLMEAMATAQRFSLGSGEANV